MTADYLESRTSGGHRPPLQSNLYSCYRLLPRKCFRRSVEVMTCFRQTYTLTLHSHRVFGQDILCSPLRGGRCKGCESPSRALRQAGPEATIRGATIRPDQTSYQAGCNHSRRPHFSQFFNGDVLVGINADFACDLHCLLCDFPRAQFRELAQGAGSRKRERSARTDSNDTVIRLNQVAGA